MPNERLTMRMIREILRLHYSCGLSNKKISQSLRCSRTVIANYLKRAQAAEVTWPLPDDMDDDHLETLLFKRLQLPRKGKGRSQTATTFTRN